MFDVTSSAADKSFPCDESYYTHPSYSDCKTRVPKYFIDKADRSGGTFACAMGAYSGGREGWTMAKHTIVLIPGDGIGPEVTAATTRVLEAAGLSVEWVELPAGSTALEQGFDNVLPERTLAAIKAHRVALKGPVTTPVGKASTSVNVQLRK